MKYLPIVRGLKLNCRRWGSRVACRKPSESEAQNILKEAKAMEDILRTANKPLSDRSAAELEG